MLAWPYRPLFVFFRPFTSMIILMSWMVHRRSWRAMNDHGRSWSTGRLPKEDAIVPQAFFLLYLILSTSDITTRPYLKAESENGKWNSEFLAIPPRYCMFKYNPIWDNLKKRDNRLLTIMATFNPSIVPSSHLQACEGIHRDTIWATAWSKL